MTSRIFESMCSLASSVRMFFFPTMRPIRVTRPVEPLVAEGVRGDVGGHAGAALRAKLMSIEADIGKISAGMSAYVTADAFGGPTGHRPRHARSEHGREKRTPDHEAREHHGFEDPSSHDRDRKNSPTLPPGLRVKAFMMSPETSRSRIRPARRQKNGSTGETFSACGERGAG